jgi:tetratricopeptide (TPR) repeat protein
MGNRELFLAEASKALELNSSDGTTLGLIGMYTAWAGDWDRGLEMMEKAKLLNPNYPPYYHVVFGTAAYARGDYENAIETLLKADLSDFPPYLIFLAASYIDFPGRQLHHPGAQRGCLPPTRRPGADSARDKAAGRPRNARQNLSFPG